MSLLNTARFLATHPLTRRRRLQSFLAALKWQIGIRLVPGEVLVNWVGGAKFITGRGDNGITGNIYAGLHDFSEMAFLLHATAPTDLFIDVGANVGAYTLLACVAKGARGYCFEPVPSTYARLLRNLTINGLSSRVKALNIGISDAPGTLSFTSQNNCGNHVVPDGRESAESLPVPVQSLDGILQHESPTILKIDVEGFENKVLAGARDVLAKPSLAAIIIEVNGPDCSCGFDRNFVLDTLTDYDFSIYNYDPFTRTLSPKAHPSIGGNTLFLRDVPTLEDKLFKAPPIQLGSVQI